MDGEVNLNLLVTVLVSAANDTSGQVSLDAFLASHGPKSINAAVDSDPTLGDTVEFANITGVQSYGIIEFAGQPYVGAVFQLQAGARPSGRPGRRPTSTCFGGPTTSRRTAITASSGAVATPT